MHLLCFSAGPAPRWIMTLEFKFPSKSQHPYFSTIKSRAKPLQACSLSRNEDSGKDLDWVYTKRRIFISISTLPFLFHLHECFEGFGAKAAESDTTIYNLMKGEVRKVVSKGKAAGVLRLVFHDAGTFEMNGTSGGMNGSIVFELDRPENAGLKKSLKVVEKAKKEVDAIQPVSWADMIAVAGAEAVSVCGGPTIPVLLGRLDSGEPDAEGKLPEESLGASSLKQCFQRKGLSTQELVALSGAHTLGSKGFGNPTVFDNSYYKILLEKPWMSSAGMSSMIGLPSDRALVEDDECLRLFIYQNPPINHFAKHSDIFYTGVIQKKFHTSTTIQ
ncbi:putative L-ascorbate peroxidase 6 isoform X2 [Ricinus communis]|uniref:putative L-ascorbate peroxidase 6 isoform X2 n=1 Tax=Ricinus communis TaxID=3988 RepID=UPI000772C869|nr:putative L-ascorbate peroxidase 6 isoform X2 [Ricinus communis]|eukprot:XP_015572613.1 putative L-ascorbate peroxidase 6 isoform X2 [Ricinus communis]